MKRKFLRWCPTTQGIMLTVALTILGCSASPTSTTTQREPTSVSTEIPTSTSIRPSTLRPIPEATPTIAPTSTPVLPRVSPLPAPTTPTQKATQPQSTTPVMPTSIETPVQSLMCAQTQGTSVEISGEDVPLHEALCVMSLDEGIVKVQVADGLSWVGIRQSDGQSVGGVLRLEESHLWGHFQRIIGINLFAVPLSSSTSSPVLPPTQVAITP